MVFISNPYIYEDSYLTLVKASENRRPKQEKSTYMYLRKGDIKQHNIWQEFGRFTKYHTSLRCLQIVSWSSCDTQNVLGKNISHYKNSTPSRTRTLYFILKITHNRDAKQHNNCFITHSFVPLQRSTHRYFTLWGKPQIYRSSLSLNHVY